MASGYEYDERDVARDGEIARSMRDGGNITLQHRRIAEGLQKLDELLKITEERLTVILQRDVENEGPMRAEEGKAGYESPMVETISSMADRLERNLAKITRLLERIDI